MSVMMNGARECHTPLPRSVIEFLRRNKLQKTTHLSWSTTTTQHKSGPFFVFAQRASPDQMTAELEKIFIRSNMDYRMH